jgi:hypothetical protein
VSEKQKIGEGHAAAMGRLGWKEVRVLGSFQESNVAQPSELGLYGNATPGEIAEARRPNDRDPEEEPRSDSVLEERLRQAEWSRGDQGRESKDLTRE